MGNVGKKINAREIPGGNIMQRVGQRKKIHAKGKGMAKKGLK